MLAPFSADTPADMVAACTTGKNAGRTLATANKTITEAAILRILLQALQAESQRDVMYVTCRCVGEHFDKSERAAANSKPFDGRFDTVTLETAIRHGQP
jgi:hypothetical protein